MSKLWLKYTVGSKIQERRNLLRSYDVRLVELDVEIGRVECYYDDQTGSLLWRSLDYWLCDYKSGFKNREDCAQDLAQNAPRTKERIAMRKEYLSKQKAAEVKTELGK